MSIALVRVDDRLIHGQVVVGWVQALGARRIVLVDDRVSHSPWERELYQLGVPPGLEVVFVSVDQAATDLERWEREPARTILLLGSVDALARLAERSPGVHKVNVGGLHDGAGRTQRLPYVYLSEDEARTLRDLAGHGIEVTAQDVPTARALPVENWT
jgi:PTS system mannose-specific IIB component/fructoselysine and glucoselysine-specific PTS system IIB component